MRSNTPTDGITTPPLTPERLRELAVNPDWYRLTDIEPMARELLRLRAEHSACYSIGESLGVQMREVKAERDRLRAERDGAMNDTRSCGELSCDECNLRTQALRAECERLCAERLDLWFYLTRRPAASLSHKELIAIHKDMANERDSLNDVIIRLEQERESLRSEVACLLDERNEARRQLDEARERWDTQFNTLCGNCGQRYRGPRDEGQHGLGVCNLP